MRNRQSLVLKLLSSTFVSYVCDSMRYILYLLFIAPHCNVTVPFLQHSVISNGYLYGVSYLKELILTIMNSYAALNPLSLTW